MALPFVAHIFARMQSKVLIVTDNVHAQIFWAHTSSIVKISSGHSGYFIK